MVQLQIKKENLDLIESGIKKTEWRECSAYNFALLFKDRGDGKRDGNSDIKEITFVNGFGKHAKKLTVEILNIRAVKFSKDIFIKQDNFRAKAGQTAIEIILGKVKSF